MGGRWPYRKKKKRTKKKRERKKKENLFFEYFMHLCYITATTIIKEREALKHFCLSFCFVKELNTI